MVFKIIGLFLFFESKGIEVLCLDVRISSFCWFDFFLVGKKSLIFIFRVIV